MLSLKYNIIIIMQTLLSLNVMLIPEKHNFFKVGTIMNVNLQ